LRRARTQRALRAARRHGSAVDLSDVGWAAVGQSTARELLRNGARDVWLPSNANAESLARELPLQQGAKVLWLHGDLAESGLSETLVARGATVTNVRVYQTVVGPRSSIARLEQALAEGRIDAVVLASPSAARGLLSIAGENREPVVRAIPAICIGERTALAAREAGYEVACVASSPDAGVVAELAAELVRTPTPETAGAAR